MAIYRESFIFRIATAPVAMFWTGPGNLLVPADNVIGSYDAIALGGRDIIDIPDLDGLIGGTAERVEFTLAGVSSETTQYAQEEADQIPGARVDIGRMDFGPDWQQIAPVEWEWAGHGVSLGVGSQNTDEGRQRTVTLIVAAGDTSRSRAPMNFFTDADQRRRSADDAVFSHVAAINNGTFRRWGPAS